jgi:hypothetical protein
MQKKNPGTEATICDFVNSTESEWISGARHTMRLSFHSFGRKRFIEGSNVAERATIPRMKK